MTSKNPNIIPVVVNYGVKVNPSNVPEEIKRENEKIRKAVMDNMKVMGFQNTAGGGILVSEVMHTGIPTDNFWEYMDDGKLGRDASTFYTPAPTPFLVNHNTGGEYSDVVGRGSNLHAEYIKRTVDHTKGKATGYIKVGTYIPPTSMIGNERTIDLINARQIVNLSASAISVKENNKCSICGENYFGPDHSHFRGEVYKGKVCIRQIYGPRRFREYSSVPGNPGDMDAILREMSIIQDSLGSSEIDHEYLIDTSGLSSIVTYDAHKVYSLGDTEPGENPTSDKETMMDEKMREFLEKKDAQIGTLVDSVKGMVANIAEMTAIVVKTIDRIAIGDQEGKGKEEDLSKDSGKPEGPESKDKEMNEATRAKLDALESTLATVADGLKSVTEAVALLAKASEKPEEGTDDKNKKKDEAESKDKGKDDDQAKEKDQKPKRSLRDLM